MSKNPDSSQASEELTGLMFPEDIYQAIVEGLEEYKLIPDPLGDFAGHHVYKVQEGLLFDSVDLQTVSIKGLKTNPKLWRQLRPQGVREFNRAVRNLEIPQEVLNKEGNFKTWLILCNDFVNRKRNRSTMLYQIAMSQLDDVKPTLAVAKSRLTPHKITPKIDWFKPDLTELDPRLLLTILPDAEADMLMMILGRVVVGASNERLAHEGRVNHAFAHMGILVGGAKMGKSVLLGYILQGLQACGFKTTGIKANINRFGLRKSAESDLTFNEDFNAESQLNFLKHPDFKSLISNGCFDIEDKGVDAVTIQSRCVFLGLSNDYKPGDYLKLDAGVKRRLNYLKVYERDELNKRWMYSFGDGRTFQAWGGLGKKYKAKPEVLALYLLARSAEKFLKVTGHELHPNLVLKNNEADTLDVYTDLLRERYAIATTLTHVSDLVEYYHKMVCFAISTVDNTADRQDYTHRITNKGLSFDPTLLSVILGHKIGITTANRAELSNAGYKDLDLLTLDRSVYKHLKDKLGIIRTKYKTSTLDEVLSAIVSELKSTCGDGMGYPQSRSEYVKVLRPLIANTADLVADYRQRSEWRRKDLQTIFGRSIEDILVLLDDLLE